MLNPDRMPTKRDILLLRFTPQSFLVIACDSSGGVGPKSQDSIKVPAATVGKYAARTVLLELICAGANILALTAMVASEYDPTGKGILGGMTKALRELGLRPPVVWSTEKNFTVNTTGVGITALGRVNSNSLRIGRSKPNDSVILFGQPSVGEAVIEAEERGAIPSLKDVMFVLNSGLVHEILPVGSTGVIHETSVLAEDSGLIFESSVDVKELRVSGGPSTALLLTISPNNVSALKKRLHRPFRVIGTLMRRTRRGSSTSFES